MAMLAGFPMVNQNTAITSDGRPSENAPEDCVAASLCAMCMYLNGVAALDHDHYNPDAFKDAAYGEALRNSGTAALKYVDYCRTLGVQLSPIEGDGPALIQRAHACLAQGTPVAFTQDDWIVDTSLPEYQGWTHVAVWYADGPGTLTSMDPWGGFPRMKSDAGWLAVLRAQQIWIAERIEPDAMIDIHTPMAAFFFEELNPHQWRCKKNGKVLGYGMLNYYKTNGMKPLCGLSWPRLPLTNERAIETFGPNFEHLKGNGIVLQVCEAGALVYDPKHLLDAPPEAGDVYPLKLYDESMPTVDPLIAELNAKVLELQAQITALQKQADTHTLTPTDISQLKAIAAKL